MKKTILFFALVSLMMTSFAQQPGRQRMTVEERVKMTTEWMTKELNLTEEQIAPVDSINELFIKAQQIIFENAGEDADREKIMETMQALNKEKENALAGVLTEEQLETYKKKIEEQRTQQRQRGPRDGQGRRGSGGGRGR